MESPSALARLYLERVGLAQIGAADLATLERLQRAHRFSIPFENLDIPLGRGIRLDPERLEEKLLAGRRGGYCFEQNALFLSILREAGFAARPILARVWLAAEGVPPRTHTLNLVELGGDILISDVGFGGGFVPPMRLAVGEEIRTEDLVRHRLSLDEAHGWMLERDAGDGWRPQYSFLAEPVWPADLEAANHFTATRPGTRFTTLKIASMPRPDGYVSLVDRQLTVSGNGSSTTREIGSADEYRAVLGENFGLDLDPEEVAALGLFRD